MNEPWWNDGDKISGLAATVVMLCGLSILVAIVIRLIQWIVL